MGRSYNAKDLKERLVELLQDSRTGLSGVEISERLGVSRVTITKYLGIFAAEGVINQKSIGNVTLWSVDRDVEQYRFPDDYYMVQKRFSEMLASFSVGRAQALIRNCINSGATIPKLATEVILPSVSLIRDLFNQGRMGIAEESLLKSAVSESIGMMEAARCDADPAKSVIVLAADPESRLASQAASAAYRAQGWNVFPLGDMSAAVDVFIDLDLQKLLSRVWKKRSGTMVVSVFASSEEGLHFFAEAVAAVKSKSGRKRLLSAMCGPAGKKTEIAADLVSDDLGAVLQWSEAAFESHAGR